MKRLTLVDKAFLLKSTPLFASLDLDELLPIADKLSQSSFSPSEAIFREGDPALRMYVIAKGSVELFNVNGEIISTLTAVDFFGDESIFNDQPRAYSSRSCSDSILLSISRTNLMTIISECPSVAVGLLKVYTASMPLRPRLSKESSS